MYNCDATWRETVPVHEVFHGKTAWQGDIEVFYLTGHPKAKRAYAWSRLDGKNDERARFIAVLEIPPVVSAETAVRVQIVKERMANQNAFTLMELLVTIAIVGVLAALLLPALFQLKKRAQQIQCANNVRQLGMILQAYVTEYNAYPLIGPPYWMSAMQYKEISAPRNDNLKVWAKQNIWKCPAANTGPPWPTNRLYMSYGYNGLGLSTRTNINCLGLGGKKAPRVSESEVVSPSDMMAIGDGFIGGDGIILEGEILLWRSSSEIEYWPGYPGTTQRSYARHQGHANVVFCDGHVESPTLQFLFTDTSDEALSRWNRDNLPHRELLQP